MPIPEVKHPRAKCLKKNKRVDSVSSPEAPGHSGVMGHTCGLSTWQGVAGRPRVQGHPPLHSKYSDLENSLDYVKTPSFKSPPGDQEEALTLWHC